MTVETMEYAVKTFYPYFWQKFKFPVKNDAEFECDDFFRNLRKAIWVHRIVSFRHWYPFVEMNLIPMASSPEMYEPFMTTCSLVTAVAAYVYDKGYHEFLDYSPAILTVFFEEFHEEVFRKFKIWDHLHEYLVTNNYSEAYNIVKDRTRGNPFSDVVFQLDFVREISLKINSKIPFSEHSAVYHQTQKVLKRFENQGMNSIDMRTLSLGVQQALNKIGKEPPADSAKDFTKSRSKQIITKQETNGSKLYSLSDLKQMIQNVDLLLEQRSAGRISSEVENFNVSVPPAKSKLEAFEKLITRKGDKNANLTKKYDEVVTSIEQRSSSTLAKLQQEVAKVPEVAFSQENGSDGDEFEKLDLNQFSKNQSEKYLLQDVPTSWSDFQQSLESLKRRIVSGIEKKSRGEGDDSRVSAAKSNEFQTARKPITRKKDKTVNVENEDSSIPDISRSLAIKLGLFEDEKVAETAGKESTSDRKCIEAADFKQASMDQSGKQLPRPQIVTISDLKQSIEDLKLQILPRGAANISAVDTEGNYFKISPPKLEGLHDHPEMIMRKKAETVSMENKDTEVTGMKQGSSSLSQELIRNEAKKTTDSKTSSSEIEEINSTDVIQTLLCKSRELSFQVDKDTLEIEDEERSIAMKETEEISLKLDKMHQRDRQLPQVDKDVLKMETKESDSEIEKAEDVDIIRDSKKQWEKLMLEVDMDASKLEDSIESAFSLKSAEKMDSKVDLTDKSEKLFQVETDVVRIKDADGGTLTEETSEIEQTSQYLLPQTDVDVLKMEEKEQSSSTMKETEDINFQLAMSYQLEEWSLPTEIDAVILKDEQSTTVMQEILKGASADQSKKQLSRDDEEMVSPVEEMESKQDSTDQFEEELVQADTDILSVKDGEKSAISVEETEEINLTSSTDELKVLSLAEYVLKIKDTEEMVSIEVETEEVDLTSSLTDQSGELLVQADMDTSKIQDSEENVSAIEESEEIDDLKNSLTDQSGELLVQADMDTSKMQDSEENVSAIEESEEMELKEASADKSRVQFLDDMDEPKIQDGEHSTLDESNVGDVQSDEDGQLEDESLMEEECLDVAQLETKDSSELTSTPKKSKKKKKRSKSKLQKMAASESDSQVPSTEDALKALISLFQKSKASLEETYDVLEIPRDDKN